jgi:hypothetical protein
MSIICLPGTMPGELDPNDPTSTWRRHEPDCPARRDCLVPGLGDHPQLLIDKLQKAITNREGLVYADGSVVAAQSG